MKHLRRSLKYFIQTCILCVLIFAVLMLAGIVSKDISVLFKHGWNSVWFVLALFGVMALVYPFFGYQKRKIHVNGDPALARNGIVEAMKIRGYVLASEQDGVLKFHLSSPVNRVFRLWEDTVTLAPVLGGWEAEGLSRDLVRVVGGIEYYFRNREND